MRFSVNLLLFGDKVTPAVLRRFPELREMGFDGVEVPVFDPGSVDVGRIRRQAEKHGLALTASGALPPGSRFYGRDAAPRRTAERYLGECIRAVAELGCRVLCGPLYKVVGDTDESLPLADQRCQTARALEPLARQAAEAGVTLALECLNRFETNFLNTAGQGIEFCRRLASPAAGLLLDTFHMHIEEKDSAAAVRAAGAEGLLAHFHASENDRGTAGTGQVRWGVVAGALREASYDGWVVLESFSQTSQTIRAAVSCWRPFYPSAAEFLRDGLRFAKETFAPPRRRPPGKGTDRCR